MAGGLSGRLTSLVAVWQTNWLGGWLAGLLAGWLADRLHA